MGSNPTLTAIISIHNHLGSPVAATNASGTLLWREDYTPFGEARQQPAANDNGESYTGHIADTDTGLIYMQARYYDPAIGRFLSSDPVGFAEGGVGYFNRYAYVGNNPLNATDPAGERQNFGTPNVTLEKAPGPYGGTQSTLTVRATVEPCPGMSPSAVQSYINGIESALNVTLDDANGNIYTKDYQLELVDTSDSLGIPGIGPEVNLEMRRCDACDTLGVARGQGGTLGEASRGGPLFVDPSQVGSQVAGHEMGHVMGLGHSPEGSGSLMTPTAEGPLSVDEIKEMHEEWDY